MNCRSLFILLAFFLLAALWYDLGSFYIKEGEWNLQTGNYAAARDNMQSALRIKRGNSKVLFNRGVVRYRLGEFVGAVEDFTATVFISSDPVLIQKALYNQGNSLARLAEHAVSNDRSEAEKLYNKALDRYKEALLLSPQDRETLANQATILSARKALLKMTDSNTSKPNQSITKQSKTSSDKIKSREKNKGVEPANSIAQSQNGQSIKTDQEGTKSRRKIMGPEDVERLLNEKRRQEALPSSVKALPGGFQSTLPAKNW